MSDIFNNFDSNDAGGDSHNMASPSQNSPMANANSNSSIIGGSAANNTTAGTSQSTNAPSTSGPSSSSNTKSGTIGENQPLVNKPRLLELMREIDVSVQLDEDVEELILQLTDDFIDDVIKSTCKIAQHRKASRIEVRDVQLQLERKYNMWIPGFGTDELRPYKRAAVTEAHKQRLALIRKTIKKY